MFNRKVAFVLFYSHIYYIKAFHEGILLDKFNSVFFEDFSFTDCHTCIYYSQEKLKKKNRMEKVKLLEEKETLGLILSMVFI